MCGRFERRIWVCSNIFVTGSTYAVPHYAEISRAPFFTACCAAMNIFMLVWVWTELRNGRAVFVSKNQGEMTSYWFQPILGAHARQKTFTSRENGQCAGRTKVQTMISACVVRELGDMWACATLCRVKRRFLSFLFCPFPRQWELKHGDISSHPARWCHVVNKQRATQWFLHVLFANWAVHELILGSYVSCTCVDKAFYFCFCPFPNILQNVGCIFGAVNTMLACRMLVSTLSSEGRPRLWT